MAALKARTEFASALNQVCAEHGIALEVVIQSIKDAMLAAYRRDFGLDEEVEHEVEVNPETGETRIFSWKEGKKKSKKDITPPGFGRIAAQVAKQVLLQKIREAEKSAIIEEYSKRVGTLVNGMILRFDGPNIIVDIGRTEGLMPSQEQVRSENYRLNQRLTFYIEGIREFSKGQQVIVSRAHKGLVEGLFRREVPEVASGVVEIKTMAREPGERTKVAVQSSQTGVDPIGSCVGQKGVRVQAVINELNGEKIDIIQYSDDLEKLILASLSPAKKAEVVLDEEKKTASVSIPADQLSLAIGKDGQNVRLAARLTGYKIDIREATKERFAKEKAPKEEFELIQVGLSPRVVKILKKVKVTTLKELKEKPEEELVAIKGLGPRAIEEVKKVIKKK